MKQPKKFSVGILYLLTFVLFSTALISCERENMGNEVVEESTTEPTDSVKITKDWTFEIYTNKNIYYLNTDSLVVTDEVTGNKWEFKDIAEMADFISGATAQDNMASEIRLPDGYENITEDTELFGQYDQKTKILTIQMNDHPRN